MARRFTKPRYYKAKFPVKKSVYRSVSNSSTLAKSGNIIPYASSILDEDRTVHYKKGKLLGEGIFIIEISSTINSLFITAINAECAQSMILEIQAEKAKEYLKSFDYDFETMASCLKVKENKLGKSRLILLNID